MYDDHTVTINREDLMRIIAHCRKTWKSSEPGFDAVTRCEYALRHRFGYVNLFQLADGKLAPSITYETEEEAARYRDDPVRLDHPPGQKERPNRLDAEGDRRASEGQEGRVGVPGR